MDFQNVSLNVRNICLLVCAFVFSAVSGTNDCQAQTNENQNSEGFVVGEWAYKKLSSAHELIEKKKYDQAISVLDSLGRKKKLNRHEKAMMWQTYGFVWSLKGEYRQSAKSFENCLKLGAMPKGAITEIEFNLGQIYMVERQYKKAAKILSRWLKKVENPSPDALYLLAQVYAQNKQYGAALSHLKKAIEQVKSPQESWYQFALSLYFKLNQKNEVKNTLEILVSRFPKRTYWLQLAAIFGELKMEAESLAVLELAYQQKLLRSEQEIMNLVSLYLHRGIPFKAARILDREMEAGAVRKEYRNIKILADAWLQAREMEKAIAPLSTAASSSDSGDLFVQLAQLHMKRSNWKEANRALNRAIKKDELTDPGTSYLLLGITKRNLHQYEHALRAFVRAKQHARTEDSAKEWIKIVQEKIKEKQVGG